MSGPTLGQIKAKVSAIRQQKSSARIVGIFTDGRWTGQSTIEDRDGVWHIRQCDSPLHIRETLSTADNKATTVILTSVPDTSLDDDIRIRLTKQKLYHLDSWETVRTLFGAHKVDARIARDRWIADKLLAVAPEGGYTKVASGFLDADTVWQTLVERDFGMDFGRPDLIALLKWSIDPTATARFKSAEENYQQGVAEWLGRNIGPSAEPVLTCLLQGEGSCPVPVGLAAEVFLKRPLDGPLATAAGRFERYLGGSFPEEALLSKWFAAAKEVVLIHTQSDDDRWDSEQLDQADQILSDIGAEDYAHLSSTSIKGLTQREERFGSAVSDSLQRPSPNVDRCAVQELAKEISEHALARRNPGRDYRIDMTLRLLRWLEQDVDPPATLAEATRQHVTDHGFADWARLALYGTEPVRELAEAFTQLCEAVRTRREEQSEHFASLLRSWTEAGATSAPTTTPVERVLEQIVAPLCSKARVLLVLLDGMSAAVYQELMADITRQEWCLLAPSDREMVGPAIATLPSLTNISRTSLFCSKLREGGASDEASAFKKNEALNPNSKQPAVLFHKKDLRSSDESALDSELRNAIESPQQQVVGVVVNAVDDHLAESDQLVIRWTQERVRALPMLLHEARLADRVVVLLSDHGHVIDHGAKELPGDGGERWRSSAHTPESGEVKIVGPRVMTPDNAIVAPWSESIRYKPRKNGYHGGVNPQEMVIPIAVLSSGTEVEGWSEQLHVPPDWWHESEQNVVPEQSVAASFAPPKPKDRLFHMDAEERQPEQIWLKLLGSSELLETQRSLAGRNVPSTEDIARVVSLFDERGGKLTTVALSRHLNTPAYRLSGLLAKLQRVLNLDGYGVLSRDEDSGTVELNLELLCTQFGLRS